MLRPIIRSLVPESLRLRLHYFRRFSDYVIFPKTHLTYAEDNLFTSNRPVFLDDPQFQTAYRLGEQTNSWHGISIRWRAHVACWAAMQASRVPGDFVECGVHRGGLARAIVSYVDFGLLDKSFYLVDTFSGLVPSLLSPEELDRGVFAAYQYYADNSRASVERIFAAYSNVHVIEGEVPRVLPSVPAAEVAFLSLDMNCTTPEIRAAEYYWDRMAPGAMILLDDYGQPLHVEQQVEFDRFARARGVRVLSMPTGQGLLVKPPL